MSVHDRCIVKDCENEHTPQSAWCLPCRSSLYRWLKMSPAQRKESAQRGHLRMARIWGFRGVKKQKTVRGRSVRRSA